MKNLLFIYSLKSVVRFATEEANLMTFIIILKMYIQDIKTNPGFPPKFHKKRFFIVVDVDFDDVVVAATRVTTSKLQPPWIAEPPLRWRWRCTPSYSPSRPPLSLSSENGWSKCHKWTAWGLVRRRCTYFLIRVRHFFALNSQALTLAPHPTKCKVLIFFFLPRAQNARQNCAPLSLSLSLSISFYFYKLQLGKNGRAVSHPRARGRIRWAAAAKTLIWLDLHCTPDIETSRPAGQSHKTFFFVVTCKCVR